MRTVGRAFTCIRRLHTCQLVSSVTLCVLSAAHRSTPRHPFCWSRFVYQLLAHQMGASHPTRLVLLSPSTLSVPHAGVVIAFEAGFLVNHRQARETSHASPPVSSSSVLRTHAFAKARCRQVCARVPVSGVKVSYVLLQPGQLTFSRLCTCWLEQGERRSHTHPLTPTSGHAPKYIQP